MVNWIRKDVHIIHQKHLETSETKKQVVPHSTLGPNGAISNPKPDPLSRSDLMINLQNLRFRSSN